MNYFGPEKSRKAWQTQIATPVGAICELCHEAVKEGDIGHSSKHGGVTHYECLIRSAVGSVGHQKRLCSCYGGTEDDPPGMTPRQAAIAAARLWDEAHT